MSVTTLLRHILGPAIRGKPADWCGCDGAAA